MTSRCTILALLVALVLTMTGRAHAYCGIDHDGLSKEEQKRLAEWHKEVAENVFDTIDGIRDLFEKASNLQICAEKRLQPHDHLTCVLDGPDSPALQAKLAMIKAEHSTAAKKESFLRNAGWGDFVDANRALRELPDESFRRLLPLSGPDAVCRKFKSTWDTLQAVPPACKDTVFY